MKSLSSKEIYEILKAIEVHFDVDCLKFKSHKIWPIVRSIIGQQLFNQPSHKREHSRFSSDLSIKSVRQRIKLRYINWSFKRSILAQIKSNVLKSRFIYISKTDEMRDHEGCSILGKGVSEILKDISHIEILDLKESPHQDLLKKLNPYYFHPLVISRIQGLDEFLMYLTNEYPDLNFDISEIQKAISVIWSYADVFEAIFKENKTQFVFYSVFFHPVSYGITLAANQNNICSVEIQHGQQGKYSPLNLGMFKHPSSNYSMLPKFFWAWGNVSKRRKVETFRYSESSIVVGGNPSFFFKSQASCAPKAEILIALQKLNPILPEFLFDFLQNNRKKVIVRLHPHMDQDFFVVKEKFERYPHVEVQKSTEYPLYSLLDSVKYVITNYSSVVLEAAALNKVGIIIHKNGFDLMEENLQEKEIFMARNREDLEYLLTLNLSPSTNFLETNIDLVYQRLKKLLTENSSI